MNLKDLLTFNSINKKFLVPTLIFMVILLSGLGKIIVDKNQTTVRSLMDSKGNAMAGLLAQISVNYVMNYDLSALEGFVRETVKDPEVAFVVFYDANKKTLTENSKAPMSIGTLLIYEREIRDIQANDKLMGYLRLGYSDQTLSRSLRGGIVTVIIGILVALILLIFGVTILFRGITRPLGNLAGLMENVARGDLTVQVESSAIRHQDEVGILARAFVKMSDNFKGVIQRIQETSKQVTLVAEEVSVNTRSVNDGAVHQAGAAAKTSSSVDKLNVSINKIAENVGSLSSSAQDTAASLTEMSTAISQVAVNTGDLSSTVEDTASSLIEMSSAIKQVVDHIDTLSSCAEDAASSMNEMNASIREVEKNAKESALLTEKVNQEASELGVVAIEQTIEGMEQIKKSVDKSASVINKLEERAQHIGNILIVIDDVMRQTNLLALNASILAAQAGNEGKGFAVVAEEIKQLADRTAASTEQIAQLIQDVQTETKDAVVSAKEGSRSVEEGVRRSMNARGPLKKILDSSKLSSDMSRHIEKSTLEQVKAAGQIAGLIEKMNTMVQKINHAMRELQNGTLHITQSSEKIKSITHQLKIATEEQAKGSRQISEAGENVNLRVQEISGAMKEQKKGSEEIIKSILEIQQIAEQSVRMVQQMNQSMEGLINQSNLLKEGVHHFKI
jgi:methyl-accepting chemotaxis protein